MEKRKKKLMEILNDLKFFYPDLNNLIVTYDAPEWEGKEIQQVKMTTYPWKMTTDSMHLYVCMPENRVVRYSKDTLQVIDKFDVQAPDAIDIFNNELYVYEFRRGMKVFNIFT